MGTGRGWSSEETTAACRAYTSASENPRKGSGKKKEVFSNQVLEIYKRLMTVVKNDNPRNAYGQRTGDAIIQRFRKARCECLRFDGIVSSIKARGSTGSFSDDDIARTATAIYNGEATLSQMYTYLRNRTADVGSEFVFKGALGFLRTTHTWDLLKQSQEKRQTTRSSDNIDVEDDAAPDILLPEGNTSVTQACLTSTPANPACSETNASGSKPVTRERPSVNKRALDISKQLLAMHKGADAIEKMAEASRKRSKLAEELLNVDKQKSLISLFSMPGTDPGLRMRFMRVSQLRALRELEGTVPSHAESVSAPQSVTEPSLLVPPTSKSPTASPPVPTDQCHSPNAQIPTSKSPIASPPDPTDQCHSPNAQIAVPVVNATRMTTSYRTTSTPVTPSEVPEPHSELRKEACNPVNVVNPK